MPRSAERTEEIANAASHGLPCLLALLAWPALAMAPGAARHGLHQPGSTLYLAAMLLMFTISAAYHAAPAGAVKSRLRRLDHATIFFFIAGSCTAFAFGGGDRPVASGLWPLLGAVWTLAALGMALKLADRLRQALPSTLLYLGFGWLAAAAALPALLQQSAQALALCVAGGLAYTVGCGFYLMGHRVRWGHLVWHLFVIFGSACHLLALVHDGH